MEIIRSVGELTGLTAELDYIKGQNKTIGFVPTMGALHQGHLSLIENAARQNDFVVVSIFVNPTQFNNPDDLKNYPRNPDYDLKMLENTQCDIVFTPEEKEIYPDHHSKESNFNFGHLGNVMEGKYRPGHFGGVANVVKRLFEIVQPTRAYFGQKDIQQFLIIDYLNKNYLKHLNIQLEKCPIIRESDGLAMSSRNVLLNAEQRRSAALISKTLFEARDNFKEFEPHSLKQKVVEKINADPNLEVEYFELVSDPGLAGIEKWKDAEKILACIAVKVGKVRLIDNICF
jgi:pantoate--beta-alanine ligase